MSPCEPGRRRLILTAALPALALPGCALFHLPRPSEDPDGSRSEPEPEPPRDVVERWRAIGKIALRAGEERLSASLDWRQIRERFRLRLSGPFGGGTLQVEGRPGRVELTTASGERSTARTPEVLLVQRLGWDLPASSLRHWITGRAHPGVAARDWTLDAAGRLETLVQRGWRIEYGYPGHGASDSLPERIVLRGERLTGRVVVRSWRTGPDA